ncbi:MAG: hypothetical protein WC876_02715 [Candidatus Thermoplasmatota archaeon]
MRAPFVLALLALTALAGCSDDAPADDGAEPVAPLVDALAAYNAGEASANIERLGDWAGGTQEIDAWSHYLFVDDDADVQILDVADPLNIVEVGRFTGLVDIQDVKVSDDGQWLFIGNDEEASMTPLGGVARAGGFYVVDVSDKTSPELKSYLPVGPRRGPHMVYYHQTADGDELVFGANADISINRFDRASGTLTELARYQADLVSAYNRDPAVFDAYYQGYAHDMVVMDDPATGKTLMSVANWDAGLRIVDITEPSNPVELAGWNDFPEGHEGNLHTVATDRIGDRTITVGAVEVGFAIVGGVAYATNTDRSIVYVWDTTDPANLLLLGTWENPDGLPSDRDYIEGASSSTHNLQLESGRIYLAHYTMGLFVLDVSTPELQEGPGLLAYRDEPDDNVWDVILEDGILYASDEVQGIVALHYTQDLVGPNGIDSRA